MTKLPAKELDEIRRTRRHPRRTQFDYLHLRVLLDDLRAALASVPPPVNEVLDVFCGSRPYEDLLPDGAHCVGLDITDQYGVADVVSDEFLPFADASFDLVMCLEAFHYVPDPQHGVAEIARVLRPGGTALITVPLVWEYDPTILERRYTGPELTALFDGWEDVRLVESGGRAVSWATLSGRIVNIAEERFATRTWARRALRPLFALAYLAINGFALLLDRLERRHGRHAFTLPMNLLVSARRPAHG